MGFGWSSTIAQTCSNAVCLVAGILAAERMSMEAAPPPIADLSVGVATDDIIILSDVSRRRARQAASAVDDAFVLLGLEPNHSKDVDDERQAVCVGVELTEGGTAWRSPAESVVALCTKVRAILLRGRAAPKVVQEALGSVNWLNLLNRPLLSVLDRAYRFSRLAPTHEVRQLPAAVQAELAMAVLMGIFWVARPTMDQTQELLMSDASDVYGLGGVRLPLRAAQVVQLFAVRAAEHQSVQASTPHEQPRERGVAWHPLVLDVEAEDFDVIIKIPRPVKFHINVEELLAMLAVTRWSLRKGDNFHRRLVIAVDSLVTLYAATKGRSSSGPLGMQLRRLAAWTLAADIRLHLIYTPSEWNMSDFPSRGAPLPVPSWRRLARDLRRADELLNSRHHDCSRNSTIGSR